MKAELTDAETVKDALSETVRRYRQTKRKERVPLKYIYAAYLKEMKDEDLMLECKKVITPWFLSIAYICVIPWELILHDITLH